MKSMQNVVLRSSSVTVRQQQRAAILEQVHLDPARFGRKLVEHPCVLADVRAAGILEEVVAELEDAGYQQMLWAIAHNCQGDRDSRTYIRETVFDAQ